MCRQGRWAGGGQPSGPWLGASWWHMPCVGSFSELCQSHGDTASQRVMAAKAPSRRVFGEVARLKGAAAVAQARRSTSLNLAAGRRRVWKRSPTAPAGKALERPS